MIVYMIEVVSDEGQEEMFVYADENKANKEWRRMREEDTHGNSYFLTEEEVIE